MTYCVPQGIPHSFFLGGPHRWTQDDRDKAFLYQAREATRCSGCGTIPSEWLDEDGRPVDDPPYQMKSRRCIGCVDLEEEREALQKKQEINKEPPTKGLAFYYVRKWGR